jgi:hypothetical protein
MGLDMYLTGEKYLPEDWTNPTNNQQEDGFRIKSVRLELGYWRKHPDLHGFIVANFAEGIDNCEPINLDGENIQAIIEAIRHDRLPTTTGFFFGASDNDEGQKTEGIETFSKALIWLRADEGWRWVEYRASW